MTEQGNPGPQGVPGEQGQAGMQGQRGRPGQEGRPGAPGLSPAVRRGAIGLLVAVLAVGGGNLWATYDLTQSTKAQLLDQQRAYEAGQRREQAQAQRQGAVVIGKLCTTFGELAANQPPAGNAKANPSRAYEQRNHRILDGVGPDIGCGGKR